MNFHTNIEGHHFEFDQALIIFQISHKVKILMIMIAPDPTSCSNPVVCRYVFLFIFYERLKGPIRNIIKQENEAESKAVNISRIVFKKYCGDRSFIFARVYQSQEISSN